MAKATTLEELRGQWEEKLTPLAVIDQQESNGRVLVILKGLLPNVYHCYRYFQVGVSWEVSCDGRNISAANVFSWLNQPSAATANVVKLPEPIKPVKKAKKK